MALEDLDSLTLLLDQCETYIQIVNSDSTRRIFYNPFLEPSENSSQEEITAWRSLYNAGIIAFTLNDAPEQYINIANDRIVELRASIAMQSETYPEGELFCPYSGSLSLSHMGFGTENPPTNFTINSDNFGSNIFRIDLSNMEFSTENLFTNVPANYSNFDPRNFRANPNFIPNNNEDPYEMGAYFLGDISNNFS